MTGKLFSSNNNKNSIVTRAGELNQNTSFLFDFLNYRKTLNGSSNFDMGPNDFDGDDVDVENSKRVKNIKIDIKPIDVLNQLETVPTPFDLLFIDEKIATLNEKSKLIQQHYAKREVDGLICRLINRKKYNKFKSFFEQYQNTTDEKIELLLDKYNLSFETADLFIPEFPDIAVKRMTEYSDKCREICKKKPVFYVIAEPKLFADKVKQRDPILLVQSPFGFYWQILGAWDKELIMLSEL